MASGTLVPFMSEVALPGDSWDIDLNCDVKTHPTIGPLFGSYKVQLDVFTIPMRLYNGKIQMNLLGIGNDMSKIKIPQIRLEAKKDSIYMGDNGQINPSCIFSYLDIRGLGKSDDNTFTRDFNAIPYLSYLDIYAQYYANKQEEIGVMIHNPQNLNSNSIYEFTMTDTINGTVNVKPIVDNVPVNVQFNAGCTAIITMNSLYEIDPATILIQYNSPYQPNLSWATLPQIFGTIVWNSSAGIFNCNNVNQAFLDLNGGIGNVEVMGYEYNGGIIYPDNNVPQLVTFPLENINEMRENLLAATLSPAPYIIDANSIVPYSYPLKLGDSGQYSKVSTQEGLLIKTYQSDLFNNWVSTEWIDGPNGVNARTAIDTSSGSFTIDTLQLSKKVYDILNRIAVSGGSYDDWLDAVYTHERTKAPNSPVYMGGLSKELAFQEVISNASSTTEGTEQPLGTLAGRGVLTSKHKGGKVMIKVNEPSYIIGIVSLTPRIDYSQGNKWDVNLKTFDDLHKPGLDQLGFQGLISDQMHWLDTDIINDEVIFKEVGKQPAWINYQTNVNKVRGNFAEKNEQMFMTLNRRYEADPTLGIKDLTTYIDPRKFNQIFADTRIDAQNFWVQIGVGAIARRKMSAKVMPNL
jgi:hypothetical protein